ncbi:IS30 family transposase [Mycoplasmopsis anatis]|uniref:IS30 family transposase n=3 Tax=Mycoplasmopsis anatis TaxID=171279 RepID=UPI001C4F9EA7|nr:IS30 family transposase [Mycoplasmopsis anatis]MBW0597166.1 IS30 family transposase [Mycoplasmopsis anatis]
MIIANIKKSLEEVVCIKTKQKHLYNNHYLIKNSDEEIRLLHSKIIKTRLLKENQMSILHFNECLRLIKENKTISQVSKIVRFQPKTIRRLLKISTTNQGDFVKKFKKVCPSCDNYINYVNYLDFNLLAEHLIFYKSKRTRLHSKTIQNKWKSFVKFWNNEVRYFRENRFSKDFTKRAIKVSAKALVNKFKKHYPNSPCPTTSTVYKCLKSNEFSLSIDILQFLSVGKYRKRVIKTQKSSLKNAIPIHQRPEEANNRTTEGHYELDTVIGKREDKYCLVTVLDRKSRKLYSVKSLKTSLAVKNSLIKIIKNNALKIKTLTIDNGSENVLLHEVINQNNLYKCDAYCSYQKGSIENIHRHIRRYITKGISMDKFSDEQIQIMINRINEYLLLISE